MVGGAAKHGQGARRDEDQLGLEGESQRAQHGQESAARATNEEDQSGRPIHNHTDNDNDNDATAASRAQRESNDDHDNDHNDE